MPWLSAMIWSVTASSIGPGTWFRSSARVAVAEPADVQLGQASHDVIPDAGACRAHQRYWLSEQAAGHEGEHLRGSAVQPLRVIDDAGQRLMLGGLRHQ